MVNVPIECAAFEIICISMPNLDPQSHVQFTKKLKVVSSSNAKRKCVTYTTEYNLFLIRTQVFIVIFLNVGEFEDII